MIDRPASRPAHPWFRIAGLIPISLLALPFAVYAARMGWAGLWPAPGFVSRFLSGEPLANAAIFGHMIAGAAITFAVPLQVLIGLSGRARPLHRTAGYTLAAAGLLTGLAGVIYIALRGTIGGPAMNAGFALYGVLMVATAAQTLRFARAGAVERHRAWALRFFVLAIASWLYRVHYGIWEIATGGLASRPDFTGLFDRVQVFAFYLPYLLLLELFLIRRRRILRLN